VRADAAADYCAARSARHGAEDGLVRLIADRAPVRCTVEARLRARKRHFAECRGFGTP
jgi:hypothetical protein